MRCDARCYHAALCQSLQRVLISEILRCVVTYRIVAFLYIIAVWCMMSRIQLAIAINKVFSLLQERV